MLSEALIHDRATQLLKQFYGYGTFRPLQLDIITCVMQGKDTLVLMPTGGGKSICYQLPAIMSDGCAIVVSPLIALMQDQVRGLISNGIPAASINSMQTESDNRAIMEQVFAGRIKLLYISPERLLAELPKWSQEMPISLIAIDEAHCISQWGHDFRPEYTKLGTLKEHFPDIPIMALTATADKITRSDIARQLNLSKDHQMFVSTFDRPNIQLQVHPDPGKAQRISTISRLIATHPNDTGIVYCMTRKGAETMHAELKKRGHKSAVYHAALPTQERNKAQQDFINGEIQVICATVAFGMGIDKSNIRWVVHNNMPASIEHYYQEIGRAGRDGMPALALMFYSVSDMIMLRKFATESGQEEINLAKLQRMRDYAESTVCRRRVLLSYFSEPLEHDCNNCDVCSSPPVRYDALVPVQKALSAIIRTKEQVGMSMLTDILRGSQRGDLVARGYNKIRTYGAGADMSVAQWQHVLMQMVLMGIVEIAYDEGRKLKVTPYGMSLLKGDVPVMMTRMSAPAKLRQSKQQRFSTDTLMEHLKKVRLQLARANNLPAYLIFSDRTLSIIAAERPRNYSQFANIEGVSKRKAMLYSSAIISAIAEWERTHGTN